jgi:catechol 2,3-dioxygenase-like lactoylglutathione lyase family enzyme
MASSILINVDVPELAAGERFYTRAFGLVRGRQLGADFLELLGWPAPLYLLVKPPGTAIAPTTPSLGRRYDRHWTPVHLDVVVDDLERALARAVEAGAIVEAPARAAPYGRLALLADPFGHGICLIEMNAVGYDAIVSGPPVTRPHT